MTPLPLSPVGSQNYYHRALVYPEPQHFRPRISSSRITRLSASQHLGTFAFEMQSISIGRGSSCFLHLFLHSFNNRFLGTCGTWGPAQSSGRSDKRGRCPTPTPSPHITPNLPWPTSVVDVPEGRVDELAHVAGALGDVQEYGDGVVPTVAQVQQGLGQAGLPCGRLCGGRTDRMKAAQPVAQDRALGREPEFWTPACPPL